MISSLGQLSLGVKAMRADETRTGIDGHVTSSRGARATATFALACLVCAGCAANRLMLESPEVSDGSQWFSCSSGSDCVLIQDPTCQFLSVNRAHVSAATDWIRRAARRRNGLRECSGADPGYDAVCREGKCSTRPQD